MLCDRNEQKVQEIALVLGGLTSSQQQVEVFCKTKAPHDIATKIATADFDTVCLGRANSRDRHTGLTDMHVCP